MTATLLWLAEACVPGIIVGVIMAVWNKRQKKNTDAAAEKEALVRRKDALEISLLVATAEMSYAQTMALKRGSPNGEVEVALNRYNRAMSKFREFEREQLGYLD